MSPTPVVLHSLTLPGLLNYLLTTQSGTAPTVLVICSSRGTFLGDLSRSLQDNQNGLQESSLQDLVTPTLHNLFTTRHIKLTFCASVQALLAYLTAYGRPETRHFGDTGEKAKLVLVNPLALHASTSSFSAQGLSRTFAAAAETALRTGVILHVVECQGKHGDSGEFEEKDVEMENGHEESRAEVEEEDPWEREVSILNVSARRFGSGTGERALAGRTVKAKRIAGRWFHFHKVDARQVREGLG